MWVQSLGREDPLEEGMATHSSILAWKIPWTGKPGGLQSMGKPPILLVWMVISAQEVLLLFFCARNLCQTLSPWVCSPVLPATQSPPSLISLGLTTSAHTAMEHGTCQGSSPPRSPADHLLPDVGCLPLALHLRITPLSLFSLQNKESNFSSTACVEKNHWCEEQSIRIPFTVPVPGLDP